MWTGTNVCSHWQELRCSPLRRTFFLIWPLCSSPGPDQDTSEIREDLPSTPQKEGAGDGGKEGLEESELKKQEMMLQYLRDTESFALQVERAIAVINTMLYWKTTSGTNTPHLTYTHITIPLSPAQSTSHPNDSMHVFWDNVMWAIEEWMCVSVVQEAVQFCVTVCEFSVANSLTGVRKMLPLVWSTDAAIKDAVVQAYRRLYLNPQGDNTRYAVTPSNCCHRHFLSTPQVPRSHYQFQMVKLLLKW